MWSSSSAANPAPRRPLFRKYFAVLSIAVAAPLVIHGAIEAWFGYRDQRELLDVRLRVEANSAAAKIVDFLDAVRNQLGWLVQLPLQSSNLHEHRLDAQRLLRQVPAVVDVTRIDGQGREQLEVSRIGGDVIGSGQDFSAHPAFSLARRDRAWFGPVTLNRGSEPYMEVAVSGNHAAAGLAMATINLKLIQEIVASIRVGDNGLVFIIGPTGRLVAHPEIERVLRAEVVAEGRTRPHGPAVDGTPAVRAVVNREDVTVLQASMVIPDVNWTIVAEQPLAEAFEPIYAALWRTLALLVTALLAVTLTAFVLARRMVSPIRALEHGVDRIGAGQFQHRIRISTDDELEQLAERVNEMADDLALSRERQSRIVRLRQFLPRPVAEIIDGSGDEQLLEPRRAEVGVLFGDLRGFTTFADRTDPADVMRVVEDYYEAIGRCVTNRGATLTHFSGDGVMVVVNAPMPSPEPPGVEVVRLAQEMQLALRPLVARWRAQHFPMGFGIGVALGEATVGRLGFDGRHDYTAVGRVVNLASRLCGLADDGQVLVDEATASSLPAGIRLMPLGSKILKGFETPIEVSEIDFSDAWKRAADGPIRDVTRVGGRTIDPDPSGKLAGGEGFEPPLAESESAVLPLDDPPVATGRE